MTKGRVVGFVGAAAVILVVVGFPKLTSVPVQGQATSTAAAAALKTAWGDPDLQGIWNVVYNTPLQRPTRYADREFFTDAERAELDKQRGALLRREQRATT